MKRILLTLLAVVMMSSFAYATPIKLVDVTKFTATGTDAAGDYVSHGWGAVNKLDGFGDHVAWKHQYTFMPPAREILKGVLTVWLADDEKDKWYNPFTWEFGLGIAEDGQWDIGAVDPGKYKYDVDVSFLEDGEFDVMVASLGGDFFINKSRLAIKYAPVPEPSTLLLLGGGLLGLAYLGRKRRNKA